MACDEQLAERIRDGLADQPGACQKKMFGGSALMVHGSMAVGVLSSELMVRAGEQADDLMR